MFSFGPSLPGRRPPKEDGSCSSACPKRSRRHPRPWPSHDCRRFPILLARAATGAMLAGAKSPPDDRSLMPQQTHDR